jgi:hypothetical protein
VSAAVDLLAEAHDAIYAGFDSGEDGLLLAWEVLVERARGDVGLGADFPYGGGLIALAGDNPDRRKLDLLVGVVDNEPSRLSFAYGSGVAHFL